MTAVTTLKKGGSVGVAAGAREVQIWDHEIKIETAIAAGLATTDYVELFSVPANTFVKVLHLENVTALSMGSGPAISLGDAGSATRFVNASSTVTLGGDHTLATSELLYTSAGSIRLTLTGGTLASGTIRVVLMVIDTSRNAATTTI